MFVEGNTAPREGIAVDRGRWPLVVHHIGQRVTLDDISALWTSNIAAAEARREPYMVLNDCRALELRTVTPAMRTHLVALYRAHHDQLSRYVLAEAWVRDSIFARGLLKAVQWRYSPPWPSGVVPTWDDAEAFCARALDGTPTPPRAHWVVGLPAR